MVDCDTSNLFRSQTGADREDVDLTKPIALDSFKELLKLILPKKLAMVCVVSSLVIEPEAQLVEPSHRLCAATENFFERFSILKDFMK